MDKSNIVIKPVFLPLNRNLDTTHAVIKINITETNAFNAAMANEFLNQILKSVSLSKLT
jgi:hypothetical protein